MEIAQRRKDGGLETNLISASAVEVNGESCVISMIRDITEIKRVETSLRASHAALRKIFDATLDIIVVTRLSDGAYIDFNQQFERIGYRTTGSRRFPQGQASALGERATASGVSRSDRGRRRGAQHGGRLPDARWQRDAGDAVGGARRTRGRRLRGHDDSRPDGGQGSVAQARTEHEGAQRERGDLPQTLRREPRQHDAGGIDWNLYRRQPGIRQERPGTRAKRPSAITSPSSTCGSIRTK